VNRGFGETGRRVDARSVLEVLGVLGNQSIGELGQGLAELRQDLRPDEVLYGLLGRGICVVLDLELNKTKPFISLGKLPWLWPWRARRFRGSR
jgi:hypothetical protein